MAKKWLALTGRIPCAAKTVTNRFATSFVVVLVTPIAHAAGIVAESEKQLSAMNQLTGYLILLTVVIISIGALVTGIQPISKPFVKGLTMLLGILVAIGTGIKDTVFDADHKELRRRTHEMAGLLQEMRNFEEQANAATSPENKKAILSELRRLASKFHKISGGQYEAGLMQGAPEKARLFPDLITEAHAFRVVIPRDDVLGLDAPAWLQSLPVDPRGLYFIGIGDGKLVADARSSSTAHAYEQATARMALRITNPMAVIDASDLRQYALDASENRASHIAFDKTNNTYRYFTLLRLDRELADRFLQLYVRTNKLGSEVARETTTQNPNEPTKSVEGYRAALDEMKKTLGQDGYAKFSTALLLRHNGECGRALKLFSELVRETSGSYLTWYNYALCLRTLGGGDTSMPSADIAFKRAIQSAEKQTFRDATLYSTYGAHLFRGREYANAVPMLEQALKIDPEQPRVKAILLEAAKRK